MKALYWIVGILAALVLAFWIVFPSNSFKYRITVIVDTPQGPKTGSSVIEVHWQSNGPLAGLSGGFAWDQSARGVAPIVDLGPNGTLIASMFRIKAGQIHFWAASAPTTAYSGKDPGDFNGLEPQVELTDWRLPQFVWYPARNSSPNAARAVLPEEFSRTIGGGVHLRKVTIEPTRDPVVERLEPRPEWLVKIYERIEQYRNIPLQDRQEFPQVKYNLQPDFVHTDWKNYGS